MRKAIKLSIVALASLALVGCGDQEIVTECVRTGEIQDGVSVDFNYKVNSKKGIVLKVQTVEKVTSEDQDYLESFKESVEEMYAPYKDVEHYNYEVIIEGNTLISKTDIEYSKINMDKLIEIDASNSQIIKNGQIKIDDIINLYNSAGATCAKK